MGVSSINHSGVAAVRELRYVCVRILIRSNVAGGWGKKNRAGRSLAWSGSARLNNPQASFSPGNASVVLLTARLGTARLCNCGLLRCVSRALSGVATHGTVARRVMSEHHRGAWGTREDAAVWWPGAADYQQHLLHQQQQQHGTASTAATQPLFSYKMASSFQNPATSVSTSPSCMRGYDYGGGGSTGTMPPRPGGDSQWWYPGAVPAPPAVVRCLRDRSRAWCCLCASALPAPTRHC